MNLQNNFNKLNSKIQEVFENWDNKILPHLPQQMDEMAKRTGALHRKRGVCSCVDLLRMLFLYASSNFSFRILAAAACALGISTISDTAWRKRFSKAAPFLREILHSLLSAFLPAMDISAFDNVKNVLLVDASVICQNGKQQHQQRIHWTVPLCGICSMAFPFRGRQFSIVACPPCGRQCIDYKA